MIHNVIFSANKPVNSTYSVPDESCFSSKSPSKRLAWSCRPL